MSEHTPGPWGVVWQADVERIRLNGSTVYQVSDVTDPEFPSGKPRYNLADLHLMAAAPELLEACNAAARWLDGDVGDSDREIAEHGIVLHALLMRAFAKAEGRAR